MQEVCLLGEEQPGVAHKGHFLAGALLPEKCLGARKGVLVQRRRERLTRARNVHVDGLSALGKRDLALLVVAVKIPQLKLKSAQRKAGEIEKSGEPARHKRTANAVNGKALVEFIAQIQHGVVPDGKVNASFHVTLAQLAGKADKEQKLGGVGAHAYFAARLPCLAHDLSVIAVHVCVIGSECLLKVRTRLIVCIHFLQTSAQMCRILRAVVKIFEKLIYVFNHNANLTAQSIF